MKKFFHWILSVTGYGLYTLAVLLLLLWYLFPSESVRLWLQSQLGELTPVLSWEISELRVVFPLSIVAKEVRAGDKVKDKKLVVADEVKVWPELGDITELTNKIPLAYRVQSLGGSVNGSFSLRKGAGTVTCSGTIENVQIGELKEVWKIVDRDVSGRASGPFNYDGNIKDPFSGQFQADLVFENGTLGLKQPIMGLERLDYNQLKTSLFSKDRLVALKDGRLDSDLLAVDFSGTITIADNLSLSSLDVQGSFEPRPELFGNLKDAAVSELLKGQLRDNKLTFSLTDTLLEPGIAFQGVSGVIDGVIQGSDRK